MTFTNLFAQNDSIASFSDNKINNNKTIGISSGLGLAWSGSIIGLHSVWYSGMEKSKWHSFDDSREWLQMDKAGHTYTANKIAILTNDLYRWAGWKNKPAALMGFGVGMGYLFSLEMLDATGKDWGFSWSDMGANTLGASIFLAQQLTWEEQRILLKFSYHQTEYPQYRPQTLGKTFSEKLLKDYNGQTYWLSASPTSFFNDLKLPKWLCFSIGYSVDGKLHGLDNTFSIQQGTDLLTFNAKRQFLFSLDVDFSQLPIKKKWLKVVVKQLNYIKIPFPALILTDGKLNGSLLYF